MKRALLLLAFSLNARAASQPETVFSGLGASLGRYPRVTARATYDPKKAAQGGMVFIVGAATDADEEAIRLSEGVVATSGGVLSRAAQAARAHRVPAILLPRAAWKNGVLELEAPRFSPAKPGPDGTTRRALAGTDRRRISEGEVVTVDAAQGLLETYEGPRQETELDLASAVRAFEGLRDPSSLIQWFASRADENGAALAARLDEELAPRVAAGTVAADDFEKARAGFKKALGEAGAKSLAAATRPLAARLGADESEAAGALSTDAKEAATKGALERVSNEAEARASRLNALARTLGEAPGLRAAAAAFAAVRESARNRAAGLKEADEDWRTAAAAAGAPAPKAARLGPELYKRFLDDTGLGALLSDVSDNASLDLRHKAERVRPLFESAKLDAASALAKDILAAAPAGDSFDVVTPELTQTGVSRDKLLDAVKKAWASYWGPAPLGERLRSGAPLESAVLLEAAAKAEVSGTVFSRDPGTLRRERVVVEAGADEYALDRASGREVLPAVVAGRRLSKSELSALAKAARALDAHFGAAVEARFALTGGKLSITAAKVLPGAEAVVLPKLDGALPKADVEGVKTVR